jgi:hypothetical protein
MCVRPRISAARSAILSRASVTEPLCPGADSGGGVGKATRRKTHEHRAQRLDGRQSTPHAKTGALLHPRILLVSPLHSLCLVRVCTRCTACRRGLLSVAGYVSLIPLDYSFARIGSGSCALVEANRADNDADGVTWLDRGRGGGNERNQRRHGTKRTCESTNQKAPLRLAHLSFLFVWPLQKPRASIPSPLAPSWPLFLLPQLTLRPLSCSSASMAEARRSVVCDTLAPDGFH